MKRALAGLKILDFTRVYSGPYCTMLLADLGAEVIKVEAVGKGDDTRLFYPIKNGQSGYFTYLNRNKKSITLNLKTPEGKETALALARWADVLVENFSAGTIKKLGLSYETVKEVNPNIIYASISGFGQSGPYCKKAAYDAVAQAMGGLTYLTGYPENEPVKVGPAISDAATGVHTAVAILAALHHRTATGEGQYIDVAMMDTVFSMLENSVPILTMMGEEPQRIGNSNPASAPYDMYHTKDGAVVIATANDSLFTRLINLMGQPELMEDPRFNSNPNRKAHEREVNALVEEWTRQHTSAEVESLLDASGIPVACAKSVSQLVEDPQLHHRNMVIEQEVPGVGTVKFPGNPLKLQATPPDTSRRAPLLGEHTHEILKDVLGRTEDEIQQLKAMQVI
ncbi:MAG: CoA transferase [Oscillospiraceae bacterium]|nr:CoA transferase [Oscillospiraceae bacterium]